MIPLQLSA